ncbi:MAG: aldo/keto reductase [Bacteroidaceae bacterium]|nr:aldo/keto reductase [Bacteroidaceae bacterium]
MDRRDFIKYMGAGAAALALDSCTPKAAKNPGKASTSNKDLHGEMLQHYPGIGVLGYGCMRWPQKRNEQGRNVIDQEEVNRLVDYALEHGVNYFDTSPVYLGGDSERATAEALNRHPRDKWILATKLSVFGNSTYDGCVTMYRRSLEIFKTDYIDYYLLHSIQDGNDFRNRFENTGIMEFLVAEREAGHIRKLGFSFHGHKDGFDEMMILHDKYHWDFVQIQMNYVDWEHPNGRNTRADYLYAELDKREIPIVIMEPLRGGALSDVPAQIADQLKQREPERSIASWAFRYVGSFPRVLCALSGMTYMEHLQDNLESFLDFQPLDDEEKKFLLDMATQMENYPLVKCTACNYCMPCPYGINIPGIFKFYNDNITAGTYVKNKEQEHYARARRKYLLAYNEAIPTVRQADHCIACRRCERDCPQNIRIPDELRRIDRYIESLKRETIE